jgi:enoyl-CoA hydratase
VKTVQKVYSKLSVRVARRVGYLLLDSGARLNTLSMETLGELSCSFSGLQADPEVAVIVISGYPGDSFAVGADISQMLDFSPADALSFGEAGQALFEMMEDAEKPVIAALNGITMGGGCDLSLACDLRLASDKLRFAHPGARLGILTGFCGTQKLPRLIGRNKALEIFMTSQTYAAADALRMGYVNRVYPAEVFWDEVRSFAEEIAAHSIAALGAAKRLVNSAQELDLKNGCALERGFHAALSRPNAAVTGSCA